MPPKSKKVKGGFAQQLDALQGLWAEVQSRGKNKGKLWLVDGAVATHQVSGGSKGKRFKLTEGSWGELLWGGGEYVLDPAFKLGDVVASWHSGGSTYGKVHFSWRYEGQASGNKQPKPLEDNDKKRIGEDGKPYTLKEMMHYYSKEQGTPEFETLQYFLQCDEVAPAAQPAGKANGKGKGKSSEERRIDPADGQAYTWSEFRKHYSSWYTKVESERYWANLKVVSTGAKASKNDEERRIDPADGKAYTREEMRVYYYAIFTKKGFEDHWSSCKVQTSSNVIDLIDGLAKSKKDVSTKPELEFPPGLEQVSEQRIDPTDGMAYTWEEMRKYYSAVHTKRAMEEFWAECEVPTAGSKRRGKGR